jgi:hypothetical protein
MPSGAAGMFAAERGEYLRKNASFLRFAPAESKIALSSFCLVERIDAEIQQGREVAASSLALR